MEKYTYSPILRTNYAYVGDHNSVSTITKDEALILAQNLINAARDDEFIDVRLCLEVKHPENLGEAPTVRVSFGDSRPLSANLHWLMSEGNVLYELSEEWLNQPEVK